MLLLLFLSCTQIYGCRLSMDDYPQQKTSGFDQAHKKQQGTAKIRFFTLSLSQNSSLLCCSGALEEVYQQGCNTNATLQIQPGAAFKAAGLLVMQTNRIDAVDKVRL